MSNSSTIIDEPNGPGLHPGAVVLELFLKGEGLSAQNLANALHSPQNEIDAFLDGSRRVDAEFAFRLSRALGPSPRYWMNMQSNYDLRVAAEHPDPSLDTIEPLYAAR